MDVNSWSLLLSIVGLMLGFVSAFAHLKAMSVRLLRFGGARASLWGESLRDKADLFAGNPSALVAYLVQSALRLMALLVFGALPLLLLRDSGLQIPPWAEPTVLFGVAALAGFKVSEVTSMMRFVIRRATKAHALLRQV